MKVDILVSDLLDEYSVHDALHTIMGMSNSFSATAKAINLDPECDFRHSNLTCVDFSYSDIRGFNFTGADLRNAYGIDVNLDETTILDDADLSGSMFAREHESRNFYRNQTATNAYRMLQELDAYDLTRWMHARYVENKGETKALRRIDSESASIHLKRLITDDIDLSKRTSLFYFLSGFTKSNQDLKEIVLNVLATNSQKEEVVRSFVRVAADLMPNDPFIKECLLKLCRDPREPVREAAFKSLCGSKLFFSALPEIRDSLFSEDNETLRKKLILASANKLGARHVRSVATVISDAIVNIQDVSDYVDLAQSSKIYKHYISPNSNEASRHEKKKLQEEVLTTEPILSKFFFLDHKDRASAAKSRVDQKLAREQYELERKVSNSFRGGLARFR